MMCMTGCLSTYLNDKTAGADGRTTKEVTFYRGGFVTSTTMDSAEVNYNGVTAKLGNYTNKGDAEMGDVITAGIIGGILAYGTDLLALLIERTGQRGVDHRFGGQPLGTQGGTGTDTQKQQHHDR